MILGRRFIGLNNLYSAECIDNHPTDSGMQGWNKQSEPYRLGGAIGFVAVSLSEDFTFIPH